MSVYKSLFDWQKQIVDKIEAKTNFGLFLDMGLGKTPISLALAEVHDCDKILVVTINSKAEETSSNKGSWFWWCDKLKSPYRVLNKKNTEFTTDREVLIVNYEALCEKVKAETLKPRKKSEKPIILKQSIKDFVNSCRHKRVALIIDESHYIKNTSSMRTKALNRIKDRLQLIATRVYTYLLSGTPFTAGYEDLFAQLQFLGYRSTKTAFIDNFCLRGNVRGLLGWQQPIVGYKNVDQLFDIIHQYSITLKSKEISELKLPEQIVINHTTPCSTDVRMFCTEKVSGKKIMEYGSKRSVKLNDQYQTSTKINNPFFRDIDYPKSRWTAFTSGSAWLRVRQLSIGFQGNDQEAKWFDRSRLNQIKQFLSENPDNYILFYNYTPELLELYPICEELGYNIDVFCGEFKSLVFYDRYESQTESQRLTNIKNIILANFASGSTGKNWQLYNKCIMFSVPLYDDYEQSLKRVHRIGQTHDVVVYHQFYQDNWLDREMLKSLETRTQYTERMFEDQFKSLENDCI